VAAFRRHVEVGHAVAEQQGHPEAVAAQERHRAEQRRVGRAHAVMHATADRRHHPRSARELTAAGARPAPGSVRQLRVQSRQVRPYRHRTSISP
jgi:hypothetical protein